MFLVINTALALIPAVFLILVFYRRDRQKREPKKLLWTTFVLGFFSVIPAFLLELFLYPISGLYSGWLNIFFRAFVVAALVEEGIKLAVIRLYIFGKPEFDEINDGIVYTICASMGFACFENIMYSFGPSLVILTRGFTAVPLHAFASGIMGYYLGKSRCSGEKGYLWRGFFLAVLIHGLYDFFLFTGTWLAVLVFPLLIFSGIHLFSLNKKALEEDRFQGNS